MFFVQSLVGFIDFFSHKYSFFARILKEHEDKVKEKTIVLQSDTNKKSCCMRQ